MSRGVIAVIMGGASAQPRLRRETIRHMPVISTSFVQADWSQTAQWTVVAGIAERLEKHLNEPEAQARLVQANLPGQSSGLVQATFADFASDLGFVDEARGLFASYENKAVRPDYYLRLEDTGVLMEVERGKTTINNMDFLDFWKCHLCEHANYLFLLVPQVLIQSEGRAATKPYSAVVKRMGSFFAPRNYTNVRGLVVLGY